ncbi:hypothetical protein LKK83_01360 [Phormidium sp. CCY1219]|nr:hypothetical protein [Phormidium sp. CCY1219]
MVIPATLGSDGSPISHGYKSAIAPLSLGYQLGLSSINLFAVLFGLFLAIIYPYH